MREMSQSNQRMIDMYQAREKGTMVPTSMIGVDRKTPEVLEQGEESVHTNPLYAELFPRCQQWNSRRKSNIG